MSDDVEALRKTAADLLDLADRVQNMGDFVEALVDDQAYIGATGSIDITGADDVQVVIRNDGRVLWINAPDCRVRICCIRGAIEIVDCRTRALDTEPNSGEVT